MLAYFIRILLIDLIFDLIPTALVELVRRDLDEVLETGLWWEMDTHNSIELELLCFRGLSLVHNLSHFNMQQRNARIADQGALGSIRTKMNIILRSALQLRK